MRSFAFTTPGRPRHVPVEIRRGLLGSPTQRRVAPQGVLVTDARVAALHGKGLERLMHQLVATSAPPLVVDGGESAKDATRLVEWWTALSERNLDRTSCLVVAGGGSVLDLGAFLAATWLRGISLVVVPTTLLAQVDAGLGGKCGVNLDGKKNQVGAVKQPLAILVDPLVLGTLPALEWQSGLGEVVKTALLCGDTLLERLESLPSGGGAESPEWDEIIAQCLEFKAKVIEEDELEEGRRAVLNLGHTVGHVLEGLALRAGREVPHGVAVAAGLLAETRALGSSNAAGFVTELLERMDLPTRLSIPWDEASAQRLLWGDKKRQGVSVKVPVLMAPGRSEFVMADPAGLLEAARTVLSERPPESPR